MTLLQFPGRSHPPILTLHHLREEVRAGCGGAHIVVRTLDDVSLTIHAGELLLVHGGIASGARSLVRTIAGGVHARGHSGSTVCGAHIRRGRITRLAATALCRAWRLSAAPERETEITHEQQGGRPDTPDDPARSTMRPPVLYVLRIVDTPHDSHASAPSAYHAFAKWSEWVVALRKRGGSVLLHTTTAIDFLGPDMLAPSSTPASLRQPSSNHWRVGEPSNDSRGGYAATSAPHGAVRVLMMHAGRVRHLRDNEPSAAVRSSG